MRAGFLSLSFSSDFSVSEVGSSVWNYSQRVPLDVSATDFLFVKVAFNV